MKGKLPRRMPPMHKPSGSMEAGAANLPAFLKKKGKKTKPAPQASGTGPGFSAPGASY